jgi:uncharacterized protein GlcG (DUF336 family)
MIARQGPSISLAQARSIIDRAIAKTAEFGCAAAFVVVDAGGNLVSASVMTGAPGSGLVLSRAKAVLAALDQFPTAERNDRWKQSPLMYHAFASTVRAPVFPGAGGMPIVLDGVTVGAFSTGPGVGGKQVTIAGYDVPVNLEDYIATYALGIPYKNHHVPGSGKGQS